MSGESADVIVVGSGVVGLSVAYALAMKGVRVTVLERGEIGREASWAGAGIISPGGDKPSPLPASRLRSLSARLHEEWAKGLREETGIDNGYRRSGGVDVALDAQDEADLASAAGRWRDEAIAFEKILPRDFERVEPALGPDVRLAYFLPDRAQIRNPWHIRALTQAIENRCGQVMRHSNVDGFERHGDRVTGVCVGSAVHRGDQVVVAAGAWSESLLGILGVNVVTPPLRGQMALLNPGRVLLRRIVEQGKRYLVPRDDGRILVGSTEENVGFNKGTTEEAIRDLVDLAIRLCPVLKDAPIEQAWSGLRPGSLDTRPYLGPIDGYSNVYVASGHGRAGLQLAPGSAVMIAAVMLGEEPPIPLKAFRVDREPASAKDDLFRS